MLKTHATKHRPSVTGVRAAVMQTLQAELSALPPSDPRRQVLQHQLQQIQARIQEARR